MAIETNSGGFGGNLLGTPTKAKKTLEFHLEQDMKM